MFWSETKGVGKSAKSQKLFLIRCKMINTEGTYLHFIRCWWMFNIIKLFTFRSTGMKTKCLFSSARVIIMVCKMLSGFAAVYSRQPNMHYLLDATRFSNLPERAWVCTLYTVHDSRAVETTGSTVKTTAGMDNEEALVKLIHLLTYH